MQQKQQLKSMECIWKILEWNRNFVRLLHLSEMHENSFFPSSFVFSSFLNCVFASCKVLRRKRNVLNWTSDFLISYGGFFRAVIGSENYEEFLLLPHTQIPSTGFDHGIMIWFRFSVQFLINFIAVECCTWARNCCLFLTQGRSEIVIFLQ